MSSNDDVTHPMDLESSSIKGDGEETPHTEAPGTTTPLSRLQVWNLGLSFLAWACTVTNVTLVVGTSAVVALSLGSDDSVSSMPLGAFFFGSSAVSLTMTSWLFGAVGRKVGLVIGLAFSMLGTTMGFFAVAYESFALLVLASFFFGMATGIGFFWRFLVVELVPSHWTAKAVTLVVSGGCIAALAGPESSRATSDLFDAEKYPHMGTFFMTGVFNTANLICTLLVQFPHVSAAPCPSKASLDEAPPTATPTPHWSSLLTTWEFFLPVLVSGLSWAIMGVPMSVFRVAMDQVGFSVRHSLTTIEVHFLGMYAPGFVTGSLIKWYGPEYICAAGGLCFGLAMTFMLLANEDNMVLWVVGLLTLGIGWNFGFTGATVWLTSLFPRSPLCKSRLQAANDSLMFFFGGAWIVSASYLFQAGGSGLGGWAVVNHGMIGLLGVYAVAVGFGIYRRHRCRENINVLRDNDMVE